MTYTKEEQKQHRAELVEALRSGEYQQAKLCLHENGNRFCCLGVACDISKLGEWVLDNENYMNYLGFSLYLPKEVMKYYGFHNSHGIDLADMNDDSFTFEEIAAHIESEPEGMFEQ